VRGEFLELVFIYVPTFFRSWSEMHGIALALPST
jgi:hypothetical protein